MNKNLIIANLADYIRFIDTINEAYEDWQDEHWEFNEHLSDSMSIVNGFVQFFVSAYDGSREDVDENLQRMVAELDISDTFSNHIFESFDYVVREVMGGL